jgi:hypothetical protein
MLKHLKQPFTSMKIPMKTQVGHELLALSKEELIEKLLKNEKELALHHDLLKQTFVKNKELTQKCLQLQKRMQEQETKDYDGSLSWVSKIVFTLKKEKKPLRSIELISILERTEPVLQNHSNKAKVFSAFLNAAMKYKRIVREKIKGVRGHYYLLPEWLDENGNAKEAYKQMML